MALLPLIAIGHPASAQPDRPNVVLILADNVGYGDLGPYPKVYNIEMDPHEDIDVAGLFGWVGRPTMQVVGTYLGSHKRYPNPPASNLTSFK